MTRNKLINGLEDFNQSEYAREENSCHEAIEPKEDIKIEKSLVQDRKFLRSITH